MDHDPLKRLTNLDVLKREFDAKAAASPPETVAPQTESYFMRDLYFGDRPLDEWPAEENPSQELFPWSAFVSARSHLASGDEAAAIRCWREVIDTPGKESLQYLQAWHFLREHGHKPPADTPSRSLGVLVENMSEDDKLTLLVAYADHNARCWSPTGGGVVWLEGADTSLNPLIDELIAAGTQAVAEIGPWNQPRPGPPPSGVIRLCFLTPSGLHFGQGPHDDFFREPRAIPVLRVATELMIALGDKVKERRLNSARAVFEQHGLLGTYSADCSQPASPSNGHIVYRALVSDRVQRETFSSPEKIVFVSIADTATLTSPNEIRVTGVTGDGKTLTYALRIDGQRQRVWSWMENGVTSVIDGVWAERKYTMPWLTKCE